MWLQTSFCFTPWSDCCQVLRVCCPPVAVLSVQFMLEGAGVFRTNWRQFMAVLWRVNLLPSRSLVNISTFFYITMLQPALDIFLVSGVHQVLIPRDEVRQKQQGGISSRPSRLPFHFFLQEWPAVVHPTSKCVTWMNKLPGTKESWSWKMRTPWIFKTFGSLQILPKSTDD